MYLDYENNKWEIRVCEKTYFEPAQFENELQVHPFHTITPIATSQTTTALLTSSSQTTSLLQQSAFQ